MESIEPAIAPERRARLIVKGHILYGKYCGLDGRGLCAERFALHHIRQGEPTVARDLLDHLQTQIASLIDHDPEGRLAMTRALADRIRCHLDSENP